MMRWLRFFQRGRWDDERAREMEAHLQHQIDDLVERGLSAREARARALREFGNPARLREDIYDANSIPIVESVARDARYAVRILLRTPLFTAAALLTLAIAIGVNTAVFTVVDAVLLEPLPYPQPDRLALVSRSVRRGTTRSSTTAVDGRTWESIRVGIPSVQAAVFSSWVTGVNLVAPGTAGGQARHVQQQRVSAGFFDTLGVPPLMGRGFTSDEDRTGGPAAVVLSAPLWRALFASDPDVVGRPIVLRGAPHTVVGIMPDGFQSGVAADIWTPLRPSRSGEGAGENYRMLLRLRDGENWTRAESELVRIGEELQRERKPEMPMIEFGYTTLQQGLTSDLRTPLLILWGAVAIVLMVACINLAGLMMARASQRRRELATRMALGSGRGAVVRQLLVESVVLAMAGGALGIFLGSLLLQALLWLARDSYDLWQPVAINGRSAIVAMGLALLASMVFGVAPALNATRMDIRAGLLAGTRTVAGGSSRWTRRIVVVAQVALGVVLLVAAGLLVRTFAHLQSLDPGFDTRNLVTAAVSLEDDRYRDAEKVQRLFRDMLERLQAAPGVESAAVALELPYRRLLNLGFRRLDGPAELRKDETTSATYITTGFFDTMRIPIRRGRSFTEADREDSAPVAMVSDGFARAHFGRDEDPVGHRLRIGGIEREIVGLVGDVQVQPGWGNFGPLAAMPVVYLPSTQVPGPFLQLVHGWFSPTFLVRSSGDPAAAAAALRTALADVDPMLPFANVRPIADVKDVSLAPQRFLMALLSALAAVAVILGSVGIHGLIATSVTERTREIGIRLALGATRGRAVRTLALPGIVLAAIGVAIGMVAARAISGTLRAFVWGVSETDPATFAGVSALILLVAVAASIFPALKVLRVDPAITLRQDT
jgi:predicted permease